ncbi:MAG: hypothetical protein WC347_06090 [Smithellaceae bacterium]|jgi:hypothetical protein
MDRKKETSIVKRALIKGGFDNNDVRVTHGAGTAWGWLRVRATIQHKPDCGCVIHEDNPAETCQECKDLWQNCYKRIEEITIEASGRSKYESEQIGIDLHFAEPKRCEKAPISPDVTAGTEKPVQDAPGLTTGSALAVTLPDSALSVAGQPGAGNCPENATMSEKLGITQYTERELAI